LAASHERDLGLPAKSFEEILRSIRP